MEEMGDDESMAMLASMIIGGWAAWLWYLRGLRISHLGGSAMARAALFLAPPVGLLFLWRGLGAYAAFDVRSDVRYQWLFLAMGSIWVFVLPRCLAFIGVSYRDDALERRNVAAAIAIAGTVVGLAVLFTGSNMGEGPSIWNTVDTAVFATAGLFAAVLVLALATRVGDTIAIERDVATGVRFAGWITASCIVLGRASAGDWVSHGAMLGDLVSVGWPALVFLVVAVLVERALAPRAALPRPSVVSAGVIPAVGYLVVSSFYVATLPGW